MSSWTRINAPDVPELAVFGHAAVAADTIYVSGMLGATDDLSGMVPGGIGPETTQAFRLVERILSARFAVGVSSLLFGARAEFDCVAYTPR